MPFVWAAGRPLVGREPREEREDERMIAVGPPQCQVAAVTRGCGSGWDTMFDARLPVKT
jgi:hypothetical protein